MTTTIKFTKEELETILAIVKAEKYEMNLFGHTQSTTLGSRKVGKRNLIYY